MSRQIKKNIIDIFTKDVYKLDDFSKSYISTRLPFKQTILRRSSHLLELIHIDVVQYRIQRGTTKLVTIQHNKNISYW